jgi:SAM-dependent methyltransferase
MQPHLIDDLAYKETFYWWHRVRRRNLFRMLGDAVGDGTRVLEIGCGTGANLRRATELGAGCVGIDLDVRALAFCRELPVVRADALADLPFADRSFDVLLMLDVLEHLTDPAAFIGEAARVLSPGGSIAIMVPAGPELWSYWDEMHGHQRRYTRRSLAALFSGDWRRRALEYSFSWMYPAVWVFRRAMEGRQRSPSHSDFIELPRPLNALQIWLGRIEAAGQRLLPAPFGTTVSGVWVLEEGP